MTYKIRAKVVAGYNDMGIRIGMHIANMANLVHFELLVSHQQRVIQQWFVKSQQL
jgi:hypothetical protein